MSRTALWPLLFFSVLAAVVATISDLRLCGDPECKEPISEGVTVLGYPSNDKDILSFPNNARVQIYSKEAGSRQDLWGVEIKGKRGYAPLKYIRELKIHKSKPEFSVPTEAFVNNGGDAPNKRNIPEHSLGKEVEEKTGGEVNAQNVNVAITAEDVEYNNLQLPPAEGEDLVGKDTTSQDTILSTNEQKQKSEASSSNEDEKINADEEEEGEEENGDDEEEQQEEEGEEEEEEEERDEGEVLNMLGSTVEATESSIISDQGKESKERDIKTGKEEAFSGETAQVKPNMPQSEIKSEPEPQPELESESGRETESELPVPESPSVVSMAVENTEEAHSSVTLEPSSVAFEVIDGTTVYLDEDVTTATTTPRDTQSSLLPQSSPVLGEAASTLPIPALLHHSPLLGSVEQPKDVNSPTEDPGVKDDDLLDSKLNQSQLPEDTISSPAEEAHLWDPSDNEKGSSPFQDMTSVTPTIDNEAATGMSLSTEEEKDSAAEEMKKLSSHVEEIKLETREEGGSGSPLGMGTNIEETEQTTEVPEASLDVPKPEDISDIFDATTEEPVESEGFFASWFGSSETTDPPEAEEAQKSLDPSESEKVPHGGSLEVEAAPSEDSRAGAEAAIVDYSAGILPPDSITAPVDEIKNLDTIPQTPHAAEVDHNASNSYHSNLSSVENSSSASSGKELNPEVLPPTSDNDSPIDLAHDTIDLGNSSEEEAGADIGGAEEDPGPSTARPMYADPEPTTQSYPDSYVDPDDLARLAGNNDEVSGEDVQGSSVEDSITQKFLKTSHNLLPEGLAFGVEAEMAEPEMSHGALVFLGIVVFTIITIYLVHLVMMKFSRESPILEALNNSDREKRLLTEENKTLHEELCKARAQLGDVTSRTTESSEDISELDSQLEHMKAQHANETAEREAKMVQLEHELEEATANGIEMHKMLSEMLSTQKDTSVFQASVDHLQAMLDGQREKVETLNSDLALKSRLNEELHMELSASREQGNKLDSQVQQLTQSLKEVSASKEDTNQRLMKEIELVRELQDVNNSLSKQAVDHDGKISSLSHELQALQDTITTLRESVHTKDSELKVAKECLKQLRLTSEGDHGGDEDKLSSLFDVIRIKAELERVNSERTNLLDQLRESEMAQKNLEDAMSSIRSEVTDLRALHDGAIQEKQEAMSKLAVLTQYFEEKEAQLTKELESQEGLRVNAEGTAASVAHKIQAYELELASYKTQVESLRKELQAQENSYKTQISSYEQKAHDNWLQARAAERKHDEQRQENSQLRNRLTLLQKEREEIQVGVLKPAPKRLDANGRMPSPGPIEGEVDGDHSESPPHPLHGPPPMLPLMFPPGAPLPQGIPPPHGFPHGVPPPPPPGLPRGVPPPPFLAGESPFIRPPMPPLSGNRRQPPAGGMSSPPFRRSGSPLYNHRNDRYSPSSEHSHVSDRHYSPPPLRHRPPSPDLLRRNHSPDRRSDRLRSPDRRSDRIRSSPDHHRSNRRTPDRRLDRRSPDRHFTRSPDGYHRHRSSPHHYYDHSDYNSDDSRLHQASNKGKKTSTPLGSADRWKNDA